MRTGFERVCALNFDVGTLSFLFIVLFMIHEFEELIIVRAWVDAHRADAVFERDLWVRRHRTRELATLPALIVMVAEQFVLGACVLLGAIVLDRVELVIALFIANALHLVFHLLGAWQIRRWSPGSVTAFLTLLPSVWVVCVALSFDRLNISATIVTTLVLLALMTVNLLSLERATPTIDALVKRWY